MTKESDKRIDANVGSVLVCEGNWKVDPRYGRKRVQMIAESWARQKEVKNIMLFLQEHQVSTSYASVSERLWITVSC